MIFINESTKSSLDNNYKSKGKKNLSSFKKVHITEAVIDKYKKEYPFLKHVRCKDTKEYICDGYIWFDNDELVAMVGSSEYRDDKTKWVVSLEITKNYKGYGLSKQILDYAVKTMNCKYLSVNKNNKIAKKVYDDYGFKIYQESDTMYYMTIDKNVESGMSLGEFVSSRLESINTELVTEANKVSLKTLYHLSQSNLDGKTLNPSAPNNYFTKNGYEDATTKRVCFAPSIDKCLRALSQKCTGMELYVHIPDGKFEAFRPTHSEVPDGKITGEIWVTKPVKVKCIGKIKVIGDRGEDGLPFKYGDKTAELYDWDWEWMEKINESYFNENLVFNKKDLEINLDKFESGEKNILLITGFSGSGKSTLAKSLSSKYKCANYELDCLNFYYSGMVTRENLIGEEDGLVAFIDSKKLEPNKSVNNKEWLALYRDYIKFLISWCEKQKDKKFIIEGLQIYEIYQDGDTHITSCPIIIKGTSGLVSAIRGAKRNDGSFAKEFGPLIMWALKDNKALNKLKKDMNESSIYKINEYINLIEELQQNIYN